MSLSKAVHPDDSHDAFTPPPSYCAGSNSGDAGYSRTRLASLSLHMTDRLRLLHFPPETITACRSTILSYWRPSSLLGSSTGASSIQDERPYGASHEFKLRGNPWSASRDQPVETSRLICALLSTLHGLGWILTLSTDVTRKIRDKDTLVFRHEEFVPTECEWGCIMFTKSDRVRFADLPAEISETAAARLGRSWVQAQKVHESGAREIKLRGTPWLAQGTETMRVRELVLVLMEVLEEKGWTVYASIDQKNGPGDRTDTDTWYCCRPKGWTAGMPLYRR